MSSVHQGVNDLAYHAPRSARLVLIKNPSASALPGPFGVHTPGAACTMHTPIHGSHHAEPKQERERITERELACGLHRSTSHSLLSSFLPFSGDREL